MIELHEMLATHPEDLQQKAPRIWHFHYSEVDLQIEQRTLMWS
jgi:hypothetical protein